MGFEAGSLLGTGALPGDVVGLESVVGVDVDAPGEGASGFGVPEPADGVVFGDEMVVPPAEVDSVEGVSLPPPQPVTRMAAVMRESRVRIDVVRRCSGRFMKVRAYAPDCDVVDNPNVVAAGNFPYIHTVVRHEGIARAMERGALYALLNVAAAPHRSAVSSGERNS